jgi:hypothetical protein
VLSQAVLNKQNIFLTDKKHVYEEIAIIGEAYRCDLDTPVEDIAEITAQLMVQREAVQTDRLRFFKSPHIYKNLPAGQKLPHWIRYDGTTNALIAVGVVPEPARLQERCFLFQLKDQSGTVREEFKILVLTREQKDDRELKGERIENLTIPEQALKLGEKVRDIFEKGSVEPAAPDAQSPSCFAKVASMLSPRTGRTAVFGAALASTPLLETPLSEHESPPVGNSGSYQPVSIGGSLRTAPPVRLSLDDRGAAASVELRPMAPNR